MNFAEMSRRLDEIYDSMTAEELRNQLEAFGLIVVEGSFGYMELGDQTFVLEPVQYATRNREPSKEAQWEISLNGQGKVA
ncbi:MAG TPA: hypothetical protein DDW87_04680 [Firmicutes bacterium]|nr:hypothetical protein [Bacillota bacterium]